MKDSINNNPSSARVDFSRRFQWRNSRGTLKFNVYQSGETALQILDDSGEPLWTATVSLVPYGAPHPGRLGLWLKGWGGNEGLPEALAAAGVFILTGRTFPTGFVEAVHAELTDLGRAALTLDMEAARAEHAARVYAAIDGLTTESLLTLDKAARLKERLTPALIESLLANGLSILELIDMYNVLLDCPGDQKR